MKLDETWASSLDDDDFSAARAFAVTSDRRRVPTRFDLARELTAGQSVLHVGCVDHLPLIDDKIAAGTWMHEVLTRSAARCGGIDVNAEGIEQLRERGYGDLYVGDVSNPSDELLADGWGLLFLGEILEHTDDPIGFLRGIRESWGTSVDRVIVTVPNALAWSTLRGATHSVEVINTDHRFWFTPFTMAKVATRAGFRVEALHMCEAFPENPAAGKASLVRQKALNAVLARRPIFQSCVVVELAP